MRAASMFRPLLVAVARPVVAQCIRPVARRAAHPRHTARRRRATRAGGASSAPHQRQPRDGVAARGRDLAGRLGGRQTPTGQLHRGIGQAVCRPRQGVRLVENTRRARGPGDGHRAHGRRCRGRNAASRIDGPGRAIRRGHCPPRAMAGRGRRALDAGAARHRVPRGRAGAGCDQPAHGRRRDDGGGPALAVAQGRRQGNRGPTGPRRGDPAHRSGRLGSVNPCHSGARPRLARSRKRGRRSSRSTRRCSCRSPHRPACSGESAHTRSKPISISRAPRLEVQPSRWTARCSA